MTPYDKIPSYLDALKVNDVVEGKIFNILPYVVIVELKDRVKGFIPIEELSWEREEKNNPQKYFSVGDPVEAIVYSIDPTKDKKIMLSRRLAIWDPWTDIDKYYHVNDIAKATVMVITRTLIFSEIEDAVQAQSSIEKLKTELELYQTIDRDIFLLPGDTVLGKIFSIDKGKRIIKMEILGGASNLTDKQLFQVNNYLDSLKDSDYTSEIETIKQASKPTLPQRMEKIRDYFSFFHKNIQHILVVDDDHRFCTNLGEALDLLGFHVFFVHTGEETLQIFRDGKRDVDLLLLDISLPDINGIRLATELNESFSFRNIVLMTGNIKNVLDNKSVPAFDLLLKPFTAEEIINVISRVNDKTYSDKLANHFLNSNKYDVGENLTFESTKYELTNSYDGKIHNMLNEVIHETKADAGAVFSFDFLTHRIGLIASNNIDSDQFNRIKYKLPYSPIKDVIAEKEKIKCYSVEFREGKYRNLLKLIDFQSCIGIEIEGIGSLGYCLFLFGKNVGCFPHIDEAFLRTQVAATKIGSLIKERKYAEWSEQDQRFILDGQTLSALGHELKSKLTALEMKLFTLNTLLDTRGSFDRHLPERIKDNVTDLDIIKTDMFDIVRDLLRFSKKDENTEFNVNDVLERAIKSVHPFALESKIHIERKLGNSLPVIKGLRVKLEQVFLNLFLNAIQMIGIYKPHIKGSIFIKSYYNRADERLPIKVEITDSGPGIHKQNYERIFEPMFTTKADGIGMGLAICKGIINSFKGEIRVKQSIMYIGSTFIIELPSSN